MSFMTSFVVLVISTEFNIHHILFVSAMHDCRFSHIYTSDLRAFLYMYHNLIVVQTVLQNIIMIQKYLLVTWLTTYYEGSIHLPL